MNQVKELCDRILMINNGRAALYGNLNEIKTKYRSNSVIVNFEGELRQMPGVTEKRAHRAGYVELILDSNTTPKQVLERLANTGNRQSIRGSHPFTKRNIPESGQREL
jgi:ABC-2 type transport system ATP-binding protein